MLSSGKLRLHNVDGLFGIDPDGHTWVAWGLCTPGNVSESSCLLCGKKDLVGGWASVDPGVSADVCDQCVVVGRRNRQ